MRNTKGRLALAGVLALALGVIAVPATAHAAKVTETANGGPVPDAIDVGGIEVQTAFAQTFKLSGKNVKKKQVLDVNLTLNSTGSAAGAVSELRSTLVAPKGDNNNVPIPFGQNMTNLKFDQQSILQPCNPLTVNASDCNYIIGQTTPGTGTFSGTLFDNLNGNFKGLNPRGTWTLFTWDTSPGTTSVLGNTTLEVKTGKKFAKE